MCFTLGLRANYPLQVTTNLPLNPMQVGVHIADVTHFVMAGSALDAEAASRSTSTYLVDRRLDMLPGLLTETLCSLKPNEDRHVAGSFTEPRYIVLYSYPKLDFGDPGNCSQLNTSSNARHRFAFSVIWEMTGDGEILHADFCKSIIHSIAGLTYNEAQLIDRKSVV